MSAGLILQAREVRGGGGKKEPGQQNSPAIAGERAAVFAVFC
jgi:hypothetical protein